MAVGEGAGGRLLLLGNGDRRQAAGDRHAADGDAPEAPDLTGGRRPAAGDRHAADGDAPEGWT
jgi:hypothetical protein